MQTFAKLFFIITKNEKKVKKIGEKLLTVKMGYANIIKSLTLTAFFIHNISAALKNPKKGIDKREGDVVG